MENPTDPMHALPRRTPRDAKAGDALLSTYGGRLYAYFLLMLGDEAVAKRALADTLVAAAADAERPRDLDQYAPRLFALAHAECHKHQSDDAVAAGRNWTADGTPGGGRPGLSGVARRAVSRLSPEVREAFILSAPHNKLSLPQLAEVLGVGLDAAADLRAQAGLDFVRAVALCAQEAGFTEFTGAELRIRAEESLAHDAWEPPPSLPAAMLKYPARAALPGPAGFPGRADLAGPPETFGGQNEYGSGPEYTRQNELRGGAEYGREDEFRGGGTDYTRQDEFSGGPDYTRQDDFHGGPDYTRQDGFRGGAEYGYDDEFGAGPGYNDPPQYHDGPVAGYHGQMAGYRGPRSLADPLRAITGPLRFGDRAGGDRRSPRRVERRRRAALAWTGGGIAAVAVAVIAANALTSGANNTITLTHGGGAPTGAVSPNTGLGVPMGSPQPGQPHPGHARGARPGASNGAGSSAGESGSGSQSSGGMVPSQAAPQPSNGNPQSPRPVRTTKSPSPAPSKSPSPSPSVTTTQPESPPPTSPAPTS
jgi:DNA-directed RNA polymerase specialized sigma24 family protein